MTWLRLFLIFLLPISVPACGDLPQPFAHARTATAYPLAALTLDVRVEPVAGLPADAAQGLARAMAENLGGYGVTATDRTNVPSRFVLTGHTEATGDGGDNIAGLLITWTLNDTDGTETGLHVQELRAAWTDWQPVDMGLMRVFAAEPAKAVAALVGVDADLPDGDTAPAAPETLFVAGVVGAPGDGNTALAAAMETELRLAGFTLSEDRTTAAWVLNGTVTVGPAEAGQQPVAIVWRVDDGEGAEVGDAAQENAVPAGSLDGRWGPIAGFAAAAALEGIADILERRRDTGTRTGITLPDKAVLPPPKRGRDDPVPGPEKAN